MQLRRKGARRDQSAGLHQHAGPAVRRVSVSPRASLNARALRSRNALKAAAREILNEKGFLSLRVQDITERADVATGLFYRYFHDLREIVGEVTQDFFRELLENTPAPKPASEPFEWMRQKIRGAVEAFAANPGVLACMFGVAGNFDEFDHIWQRNAHRWNLDVAVFLQKKAGFSRQRAQSMAFMLGAMTEGVIYQALIRRSADLVDLCRQPRDIAEVLAVLWYRTIYLSDPPASVLSGAGPKLLQ